MKRLVSLVLSFLLVFSLCSFANAEGAVETVVLPYMLTMNAAEEVDLVEAAINEITREKIGVEVDLLCIDFASWGTQLNLMLTDGTVDLFNCCFMSPLSTYADSGALAELDDLLAEYGQGIVAALGEYIPVFPERFCERHRHWRCEGLKYHDRDGECCA